MFQYLRHDRSHHVRQTNQLDGLHDLFLRRTYISTPQIRQEIAKIVLPRRKRKELPEGVKALLMTDISEAGDDANDKDGDEDGDEELMALDDALNDAIDIDDDVELINFDED